MRRLSVVGISIEALTTMALALATDVV